MRPSRNRSAGAAPRVDTRMSACYALPVAPKKGVSRGTGETMKPPIGGIGRQAILRDASPDAVVEGVERNWRACVGAFGLAPSTMIRDDDELFWYVTGLPDASFNSVMYANLA